MFFKESGYLYRKYLSDDDKCKLEHIILVYKKPEKEWKNLEDFYLHGQLIDFINFTELSNDDLIFICKILIKTLTGGPGHFTLMPDHRDFIIYLANNPRNNLTEIHLESSCKNFINYVLLLPWLDNSTIPENHLLVNTLLKLLFDTNVGPSIAGFVAFPLLEAICRSISNALDRQGNLISNLPTTRRPLSRQTGRCSNIEDGLLLLEVDVKPVLKNILIELDDETKLYSRIRNQRNDQLHGANLHKWESYLVIFLLFAIYISESA